MTESATMNDQLAALRASVARLRGIIERLRADQLDAPAHPTKWTIADVLSHTGSGAVILQRRLDDMLAVRETDVDFAQSVWDSWNAKPPAAKAADALLADAALMDRLESLTADEQVRFSFSLGPMTFDIAGFVGLRLSEHALHTWDIEVALDPRATVSPEATRFVINSLELIARFSTKPTGREHTVYVQTSEPARDFTITFGTASVSLNPSEHGHVPDLELPAEAFIRLVYGRLDPDHTPPIRDDAALDELRRAFPGI